MTCRQMIGNKLNTIAIHGFASQVCAVSGNYVVEITFHSYNNPSGRCVYCPPYTTNRGCCDENFVRPQNQRCNFSSTCDTVIGYCIRPLGANHMVCTDEELAGGEFGRYVKLETNYMDFTNGQNSDYIPANPVIRRSNESWRVSISIYTLMILIMINICREFSSLLWQ